MCVASDDEFSTLDAGQSEVQVSSSAIDEPTTFNLRVPLLREGRSDTTLVATDLMSVRIKVYSQGGENAPHCHTHEDHSFIVLQGEATFHTGSEGTTLVVGAMAGIHIPPMQYYWFESTGTENLVLLRVGAWADKSANKRIKPDGSHFPADAKSNKRVPAVPVDGMYFGD